MLIKDFKLILHERRLLILLLILTVTVLIGVYFARPDSTSQTVNIGIADLDDSQYSQLLITYFEENEVFASYISIMRGSEEELAELFASGTIDLYLVIPEDFASRLMSIDNVPIRAVLNSSDTTSCIVYRNLLRATPNTYRA